MERPFAGILVRGGKAEASAGRRKKDVEETDEKGGVEEEEARRWVRKRERKRQREEQQSTAATGRQHRRGGRQLRPALALGRARARAREAWLCWKDMERHLQVWLGAGVKAAPCDFPTVTEHCGGSAGGPGRHICTTAFICSLKMYRNSCLRIILTFNQNEVWALISSGR